MTSRFPFSTRLAFVLFCFSQGYTPQVFKFFLSFILHGIPSFCPVFTIPIYPAFCPPPFPLMWFILLPGFSGLASTIIDLLNKHVLLCHVNYNSLCLGPKPTFSDKFFPRCLWRSNGARPPGSLQASHIHLLVSPGSHCLKCSLPISLF